MENREMPQSVDSSEFFEWADREYPHEDEAQYEQQRRTRIIVMSAVVFGLIAFFIFAIVLAFS